MSVGISPILMAILLLITQLRFIRIRFLKRNIMQPLFHNPMVFMPTLLPIPVNDSVKFTASSASTYSWDFGDGTSSTKAQPTHLFPNPTQAYTVTLYTQNNNGCKSQITQHVTPSKVTCREGFTFANVNGLERQLQFQSSQNCYWDFGDGSPTVWSKTPIHLYASKGVFTVTATQDSGFACHQKVTENVKVGNITACASNFSSEIIPTVNIRFVTINYRDTNGILYTSDKTSQPSNAFFTILKAEDYTENQQKIKKLTLAFACKVGSDNGDTHFIEGQKTIWGVQVP